MADRFLFMDLLLTLPPGLKLTVKKVSFDVTLPVEEWFNIDNKHLLVQTVYSIRLDDNFLNDSEPALIVRLR